MYITGFSSVRSSEYVVLNDLYNRIRPSFKLFYPFFYQRNRDDTILSLSNKVDNLQLVACFARRPKTDAVLSPRTIITFRRSIFEQVDYFAKYNIPVLASSPIGTGLESIGFGSECKWFNINTGIKTDYEEFYFLKGQVNNKSVKGINILENDELNNILLSAPKHNWVDIIDKIQNWNTEYTNFYFSYHLRNLFHYASGLKPVFIVYQLIEK